MRRTRVLCAAVGTRHGVRADTFVSIFKTYVRPQLEYGSVVWGDAAQTYLGRLDTVQNYAVARALGVPRYSSVAATHAELDITTLSLR